MHMTFLITFSSIGVVTNTKLETFIDTMYCIKNQRIMYGTDYENYISALNEKNIVFSRCDFKLIKP